MLLNSAFALADCLRSIAFREGQDAHLLNTGRNTFLAEQLEDMDPKILDPLLAPIEALE
ncbi:MAG: hypothetical protein NTZ94_02615 [Verrucomicrobia bacterium]|nr:hypothetical protein [Verrucomicrobiota bacterium]